jgi:nitroreductase
MNDRTPMPTPLDSDAVANVLRTRRTVHDFLPERIADDIVERAIEVARWAPNHHRTEPWRFYVLGAMARTQIIARNTELVRAEKGDRAAEIKRQRWLEVPGWLLMTCLRSDDAQREREDYAACACAAQNMMLTLWADGVGCKWTTGAITRDPELFHMLGLHSAREFVVGLFWYGRPASVVEQQRRPLAQVLARIE